VAVVPLPGWRGLVIAIGGQDSYGVFAWRGVNFAHTPHEWTLQARVTTTWANG